MAPIPHWLSQLAVAPVDVPGDDDLPRVSIVVLTLNGRRHLEPCFSSLDGIDYPKDRFDVQLIDNASDDDSAGECRRRWPWVRVSVNATNEGFARACNQGARQRQGADVLVFLNDDTRVDRAWLRELVAPLARGRCAATTAKILSWDGCRVDSAGGGMNFHGMGLQYGYKDVPSPEHDVPRKTLFACGGAMAIGARVFEDVGGFDPEFFAYYEDVDLGWRLWVQGHEVHYVPAAVCWHRHSATSSLLPPSAVRLLQVRNPLLACFKNYDDANVRRILPAALALAVRRMLVVSGIPDGAHRIERARPRSRSTLRTTLRRAFSRLGLRTRSRAGHALDARLAAADLLGVNDLLANWDDWVRRRTEVQQRRRRADADIFRLFLRPMWCIESDRAYQALQAGVTTFMGVDELFHGLTVMDRDPCG